MTSIGEAIRAFLGRARKEGSGTPLQQGDPVYFINIGETTAKSAKESNERKSRAASLTYRDNAPVKG